MKLAGLFAGLVFDIHAIFALESDGEILMAHFKCVVAAGFFLLAACDQDQQLSNDDISRDVANAIALCSSGIEIEDSVSTELQAELSSILKGDGSLNARAAIASKIRGLVFSPEVLSDPEGQKSFQIYTKCVTDNLAPYLPEDG